MPTVKKSVRFQAELHSVIKQDPEMADAAFIIAWIEDWLKNEDCALTGAGLRRFKR